MAERITWSGWVRSLVAVLIAAATAATFLSLLDTNLWWVRFLSFVRVQTLWALAVLLALSLWLPGRTGWVRYLFSMVAAVALGYQVLTLLPWTPIHADQVSDDAVCPAGRSLRLFEANVQMTNEHAEELFVQLARTNPDVVLVQEVDQWWHDRLEELYDRYPHHVNDVTQNYYGIALLSRLPLVEAQTVFLADSRDPAVFAGIDLPDGPVIRFYGVHPRPPTFGQSSAERDAVLLATALRVAGEAGPHVVSGDFNATPWSPVVRRLARIGRLNDPRVGRGWYPTWKAGALVRRWPLDHALVSREFTLGEYRVLPPFGSDHQPTLTSICYAPALAAADAPEPRAGDVEAAHRAIAAGRSTAVASPKPTPGAQRPQPK